MVEDEGPGGKIFSSDKNGKLGATKLFVYRRGAALWLSLLH